MEIFHGFILFLAVKFSSSTEGVVGSTASLYCPFTSTSSYQWQKLDNGVWSNTITNVPNKYDGAGTKHLLIKFLGFDDGGRYRCTSSGTQDHVYLTVTGCSSSGNCSQWSSWNVCSTCTAGYQFRNRECSGICTGNNFESRYCSFPCPVVDGNWGQWGMWSVCTLTCGGGTRSRYRDCNNPSPSNGGDECQGSRAISEVCSSELCPVNGHWGTWGSWLCPVTCDEGTKARYRTCNNPAPAHGGDDCTGDSKENASCSRKPCPINGMWGAWKNWSSCSVTCDGGTTTRQRSCDEPVPALNGLDCEGNGTETESCSANKCPERSESSASVAPIAAGGSVAAVILIVIIVVVFICIKRRRQAPKQKERAEYNNKLYSNETEVTFRTDNDRSGLYINIARPSRTSSSDTDDDLNTVSPHVQKHIDDSNVYHNVNIRDIISNFRVEDLKGYIDRTQVNEGLKAEYKKVPYGSQHPTTKAQLKDNMPKNRFKTTFPYDHTRVILEPFPGVENSDYVNANFVDGFEEEKCYIASQGPTKFTLQDHWRMIWQNNIRKIIMLTNLIEGAKHIASEVGNGTRCSWVFMGYLALSGKINIQTRQVKCERYWPNGGKPMILGSFVLTLLSEKERAAYITREISVEDRKTKEKRCVIQYHFTAWPDHGTPDPLYLVLFYKHVRSDHNQIENGPLLVHCSAGIGRTGTFIALDALCKEGRTTGFINILEFLKKMRYSRMNMIQTPEQYVCLHYALLEVFTMKDTIITKDQFSEVWREIHSDKRPINQQRLNEEFKMLEEKKAEHEKAEYVAALSTENIDKNRSRNSLPMDNKRLYLVSFEKGRSDFINAVQAPSYTKFVGYLTTQLPLPDTKVDFWTMMRDHSSSTIVLILNDPKEIDLVYTASADSLTCGPFSLKITKREKRDCDITESTIIISKKDDKPKEICLYQAICKDMPDPQVLCKLVDLISTRMSMSHDPVTVVSSDGAKNCGLFCAFTNAVFSMKIDEKVDIFQLVRLLQLRRPNLVADFEEYRLCYEALNVHLESTNVYANF